jgi:hypothetical protein
MKRSGLGEKIGKDGSWGLGKRLKTGRRERGDGRRGIRVTGKKKKVTNSGKDRNSLSVRFGFT